MSLYKAALPSVFPHCVSLIPGDLRIAVEALLEDDRNDVPQGSSFAVTVDNWNGTWNLWLSTASLRWLRALDILVLDLVA